MLAEAGYPDGFETELWVMNVDPNPRIAQSIQSDLAAIGVKAELKNQSQGPVIAAGGEPDQAPMIWSGGMAWIADYPGSVSNFYGPILGCAEARSRAAGTGPGTATKAWTRKRPMRTP